MPIRHVIWKVGTKPEPVTEISLLKWLVKTLVEPSRIIAALLLGGLVLLVWKRHRKK